MPEASGDPYDLNRFVEAQDLIYARAAAELAAGCKRSHWMWFVFPQIEGLGKSETAQRYAIRSLDEARAYLDHPLLGVRLKECIGLVNEVEGRSAHEIFGSPDDLKFHSSMTLFAAAAPQEPLFADALRKYFDGRRDPLTLAALSGSGENLLNR
ncbi:DUF1810 domain-containing protein [Methylocystis sp. SC2]|uniref:DUF1810 domain-containing protein n=1 Tax=Methylocystis sp. (strain SC2) TaxID=187303 RepID=UPI00027AF125|nr:DUF1810 domain-containing protein [Methylocystis sp. SC2]CCJ07715.1 Conserved hypothetical protein [Methylocystis sp. SC2]